MTDFICQHCGAYLSVCDKIVFGAEKKDKKKGLLMLHPELGNYTILHHEKFKPEEGEKLELYCPACNTSFTSPKSDELAHIIMLDENGTEFEIHFSKIQGEKSTFQIEGNSVNMFGEDTKKYIDFFNLSQLT